MEAPSVQILHKIQAALSLNLPVLLGVVPAAGAGEVVGGGEAEVETGRSFVRILFVAVDPVRVVLARVRARLTCDEKFRKVNKLCPKIQYLGRGKSYSDILLFLSTQARIFFFGGSSLSSGRIKEMVIRSVGHL